MHLEYIDVPPAAHGPEVTLCRRLMVTEWPYVAEPVRAVHARRPVTLYGTASVVRGAHWLARLLGWVAGLPPAQSNGPVRVVLDLTHAGTRERWTRQFGNGRPLQSSLRRVGLCVEERLGLIHLRFRYSLEGGAIRWSAVAGRTLGIPWPASWLRGIEASESNRGSQYYFNVRAALPGIGLVVHYVGVLDAEPG